jgi:hypothetical protein
MARAIGKTEIATEVVAETAMIVIAVLAALGASVKSC